MKLVKISGDTYYVAGMTNIGVYKDYVIDPGKNENVNWESPEVSFGRPFSKALITHGHTDHFWHAARLRCRGTKIYAPRGERPAIEKIEHNMNGFFYWIEPPMSMRPWYFRGTPCPVDGFVEELEMPVKVMPLPGHTDWQAGYLTPDGVLMAGDAIIAKAVWDTKGIVYCNDIARARQSLRDIIDSDAEWVLPSHTELLTKEAAVELAGANLDGMDALERLIIDCLDQNGVSIEMLVCQVCCRLKMKDDFSVHLVGETTVRAFLHSLYAAGAVDYELKSHRVLWRNK